MFVLRAPDLSMLDVSGKQNRFNNKIDSVDLVLLECPTISNCSPAQEVENEKQAYNQHR